MAILAVMIVLLGVRHPAAQTEATPADPAATTAPAKEVVVDPKTRDSDIARRLQNILRASGWFDAATVTTREGIVFLDGTTAASDHREWAGNVARKTEDVVAVVNRIAVEPRIEWNFDPAWREVRSIVGQAQQGLPLLVLATIVLLVSWYLSKGIGHVARWSLRDRIQSPLLLQFVSKLIAIPCFLLGIYLVLQVAGLTRLAITVLGGTGVLGIVLGFAFRDIAENFLSSLLLSVRNPFAAGDLIEVAGHRGIVQNLNTRSTVLLTLDGNHVQIPNSTVYKNVITNYSSNKANRADFIVGIGYGDPIEQAQEVIIKALRAHTAILDDPEPMALVDELAASTVNLRVYFWFDNSKYSQIKLRSALMRQVKLGLLNAGISMPDEAREVIFPEGVPMLPAATPPSDTDQSEPPAAAASDAGDPSARDRPRRHRPAQAVDISIGEGDLENEERAAQRQSRPAKTGDSEENLLKTSAPKSE